MVKSRMSRIIRHDVADGPVGSEGGRRPSALPTGYNGAAEGAASRPLSAGQRWSVGRKREVVLRLLRGEAAEDLSRELGLPLYKLERWRQKVEAALDGALKERETDVVTDELATEPDHAKGDADQGGNQRREHDREGETRGGHQTRQ